MTIRKVFSLACLSVALSALGASAADTQPQPAAKRSATKARARSFNPYDVRRTRLKINGLGFFTLLPSAPGATSATAVPQASLDTTPNQAIQASTSTIQQPATSVSAPAAQTSVSTAQLVSAAAAQLSPSAVSAAAGANILATSSVFVSPTVAADTFVSTRPPFRPPVRSPFRPPPRPPF